MRRSRKSSLAVESSKRSRTTAGPRKFSPGLERLEARELLANSFLQGLVYHDANGNGVYDNPPQGQGEPELLLRDVTVRLLNSSGVELQSRVTGADGYYLFDNLAPGNYRLVQDTPTGGFFASGAQALSQLNPATIPAGTTNRIDVDLVDPEVLNVDYRYVFGDYRHLYRGVQLFGRIPEAFIRYPDEAPVGQIPVIVTRSQQPFVSTFTYCMDLEEPQGEPIEFPVGDFRPQVLRGPIGYLFNRYGLDTSLTLDQKAGLQLAIWEFLYDVSQGRPANLRAGEFQYVLPPAQFPAVEVAANGYIQDAQAKSEPALLLRMQDPFPGEPDSQHWLGTGTFNFGNRRLANLEGYKWHDQNANGRWETSEPGLLNWTIQALQNGQVVASAMTDATGRYQLQNLMPGTYQIREIVQPGWTQSYPVSPNVHTVTLAVGQNFAGARFEAVPPNFGNWLPGTLSGIVSFQSPDCLGNQQQRGGQAGVTVYVDADDDGQLDPNELRTVTAANGSFQFTGLMPGSYRVRQQLPAGQTQLSGPGILTVVSNQATTGADFRNQLPIDPNERCGSISGVVTWQVPTCDGVANQGGRGSVTVYLDANNNGQRDPSELGTTTDASGNFRLAPTGAGLHRVRMVLPAGATFVGQSGRDYQQNGPFLTVTDATFLLQFPPTEPLRCGSISGRVTAQEPTCTVPRNIGGQAGVTVYVDANNNSQLDPNEQRAVTDANGNYRLTQMGQGNFVVRYVLGPGQKAIGRTSAAVSLPNERTDLGGIDFVVEVPPREPLNCIPIIQEPPKDLLPTNPGVTPPRLIADLGGKFQLLGSTIGQDPQGDAILSTSAFVTGVYWNVLGRTPDDAGLVSWVQQLLAGTPRTAVVNSIYNSVENRRNQVRYYYQTFLGRGTDPGGETLWVNALATGALTEKELVSRLLGSAEYYAKSNSDNATYVSRLYANILGRPPEASGHQAWMQSLQGGTTREAVALTFLSARESSSKVLDDIYSSYLDRRVDPSGQQAWLNAMDRNQVQWGDAARAVLASDEYFNRLYNLARRT